MSCSSAREARTRQLAVREAVDHQGEGEVEPLVAGAGGELGGVAGDVGEGLGGRAVNRRNSSSRSRTQAAASCAERWCKIDASRQ